MLTETSLNAIAALAKVSPADLKAAILAESEQDIAIPEGITALTVEELQARDNNQRREGQTIGREILIKEMKEKAGLDYQGEGSKDPVRFITELKKKVETESKIEPSQKVQALEEQVRLLQEEKEKAQGEISRVRTEAQQATFDRDLITRFPANRDTKLTDAEYLSLVKSSLQFEQTEDGSLLVKKGGQVLREPTTTDPVSIDQAVKSFFEERKFVSTPPAPQGGRGGSSSSSSPSLRPRNVKEAQEQWVKEGNDPASVGTAAFQAYAREQAKDNPEFYNTEVTA